jgi:hypothetical protein
VNSKGLVFFGTPTSPSALIETRYSVFGAKLVSGRRMISRWVAKMACALTFGSMVTLAEASVPTRSAGITSFKNSTRIGWWRDIAPLECMLIEPTQEGSGGALRGLLV